MSQYVIIRKDAKPYMKIITYVLGWLTTPDHFSSKCPDDKV